MHISSLLRPTPLLTTARYNTEARLGEHFITLRGMQPRESAREASRQYAQRLYLALDACEIPEILNNHALRHILTSRLRAKSLHQRPDLHDQCLQYLALCAEAMTMDPGYVKIFSRMLDALDFEPQNWRPIRKKRELYNDLIPFHRSAYNLLPGAAFCFALWSLAKTGEKGNLHEAGHRSSSAWEKLALQIRQVFFLDTDEVLGNLALDVPMCAEASAQVFARFRLESFFERENALEANLFLAFLRGTKEAGIFVESQFFKPTRELLSEPGIKTLIALSLLENRSALFGRMSQSQKPVVNFIDNELIATGLDWSFNILETVPPDVFLHASAVYRGVFGPLPDPKKIFETFSKYPLPPNCDACAYPHLANWKRVYEDIWVGTWQRGSIGRGKPRW